MNRKNESIKQVDLPFFPGVEAISGQHIGMGFRRHIHKTFIIGRVDQGTRVIMTASQETAVAEKELFIINPGQVHACRSLDLAGHSYQVISVEPFVLQEIASHISGTEGKIPCFSHVGYNDSVMSESFLRFFVALNSKAPPMDLESALYEILAGLLIGWSKEPPTFTVPACPVESITRACDYIGRHYAERLTLHRLAEAACLSPFHFQREFRKHLGITPQEYVSDYRISQSKRMLLESGNLADVALRSGFFDQSHFSRVFRKTVGITPGNYMKINRI
ncbi:AraC family transcriptional regulator [Desulfatiferula olefinivorans]